jgi:hypothetical protein
VTVATATSPTLSSSSPVTVGKPNRAGSQEPHQLLQNEK